jgi:hypothetical protein
MKQLLALILATFTFASFANEPAKVEEKPKQEMKLAKKKDHSKDKKVTANKSTADKKAASKKTK